VVKFNAHAEKKSVWLSSVSADVIGLPARHLAHALLNIIIHASSKAKQLLQLGPIEDKVRRDKHSAEEQMFAVLFPLLSVASFTVLSKRSASPSAGNLEAVYR
jgi:hypothetical protein